MSSSINPPLRLMVQFQQSYPNLSPDWIVHAPGHDMWIAAEVSEGGKFTFRVPDLDARTVFHPRSAKARQTSAGRPLPGWSRYLAGVIVQLFDDGLEIPGIDAVIAGEEPMGPRYPYAMGITIAALWHEYNGLPYTHDELVEIVERVRRDYVEI